MNLLHHKDKEAAKDEAPAEVEVAPEVVPAETAPKPRKPRAKRAPKPEVPAEEPQDQHPSVHWNGERYVSPGEV